MGWRRHRLRSVLCQKREIHLMLYGWTKAGVQVLLIWVPILSCELNQQSRSLTLLAGVIVISLRNDPTLTLANYCFVSNFALASFTLTFWGLQSNLAWPPRQKFDQQECQSCLNEIYSCMSSANAWTSGRWFSIIVNSVPTPRHDPLIHRPLPGIAGYPDWSELVSLGWIGLALGDC